METQLYQPFFVASMGAAAALLGLLFVAVSIRPEQTVGPGAPVERQVVAESVFTALINAFFISMAGTIPGFSLGGVAMGLSAFGLFQTLLAGRRLWPDRLDLRLLLRRLSLVVVALVIYGLQLNIALRLTQSPSSTTTIATEINLLFAVFAFALGRSWELLGARRGVLLNRLSSTGNVEGKLSEAPKPEPLAANETTDVMPADASEPER